MLLYIPCTFAIAIPTRPCWGVDLAWCIVHHTDHAHLASGVQPHDTLTKQLLEVVVYLALILT